MREWIEENWFLVGMTTTAYVIGWLFGVMADGGWLRFVAWAMAVFAVTLPIAAVIDHGHLDKERGHRAEMEAAFELNQTLRQKVDKQSYMIKYLTSERDD